MPETHNPLGSCYESVAAHVLEWKKDHLPKSLRVCHGICIANAPGEEGITITNAWFEWDDISYDTIMGYSYPAEFFRSKIQTSLVKRYSIKEFMRLWKKYDYPGPWDEKLIQIQKDLGKWDDKTEKLRFGKDVPIYKS